MQEKPPSRHAARQGQTLPQQGETQAQERVPRAPHERDESADSQSSDEPAKKPGA